MRLHLLLRIEGAASAWVTSGTTTISNTTVRSGLSYSGVEVNERTNPREGTLDFDSITVQIKSDAATAEFGRSAQLLTYLAEPADDDDATIDVRSNVFLSTNQFIHIGTECLRITDASTNTVSVLREQRFTEPQHHTREEGADASEIPVWDGIRSWEGRRCTIEAANAPDFSDSSVISRGRIEQAPYMTDNGTAWAIDIAHISKALDQEVGTPLDTTTRPRGLKYGVSSAFGMRVNQAEEFSITGFYETVQAFVVDLNTALAAITVTGIAKWWAEAGTLPDVGEVIAIRFRVDGSNIDWPTIEIGSAVDGVATVFAGRASLSGPYPTFNGQVTGNFASTSGLANTTYVLFIRPDTTTFGAVPTRITSEVGESLSFTRGLLYTSAPMGEPFYDAAASATEEERDNVIALADLADVISVGDSLVLSGWPIVDTLTLRITADHGDRVYQVDTDALREYAEANGVTSVFFSADTRIAIRKALGVGALNDFVSALIAAAPFANSGNVPYITDADFSPSSAAVALAADGFAALTNRDYNVEEPISVADLIAPELQLLGLTLGTTATGAIQFVPYSLPVSTTPASATFGASSIVTRHGGVGMFPSWTTATDGIVSVVAVRAGKAIVRPDLVAAGFGRRARGFLPALLGRSEDPRVTIYRDISSVSAHKNRGLATMSIEPEAKVYTDLSTAQAAAIASKIVAVYGHPYEVVTLRVTRDAEALEVLIGDVIAITSNHVINSSDGTRGVSARKARVIGRRVSFDPASADGASIEITAMMAAGGTSGPNYAGYAPSAEVTDAGNDTGNIWNLLVTQNEYAPAGSDDLDFFNVGDEVTVIETDDATPGTQTGTITAIASATTLTVSFDGAVPWGGSFTGSYVLELSNASEGVSASAAEYVWTADDDLQLHDGTIARIFA